MDIGVTDITQLSAWLAATDIAWLELSGPAGRLRLRHHQGRVERVDDDAAAAPAEGGTSEPVRLFASAGSVGVFLHQHPLHDTPLARPGARVRAGQALGLLQIGCLLLPVTAPRAATVTGTLVAHGQTVGFGAPLIELESEEA